MTKSILRNKKYLNFIRSLPCCVTGSEWEIVAHHIRIGQNGGMGLKPNDYRCIPLTADKHGELHHMGEKTFYEYYTTNPDDEMVGNLESYLTRLLQDIDNGAEKVLLLESLIELAEEASS